MKNSKINNKSRWALVTGGSSGIGYEFARQLSDRGYNLYIVALNLSELNNAAENLSLEYKNIVIPVAADLSSNIDVEHLIQIVQDDSRPVDVLVNNAGFALHDSLVGETQSVQKAAFSVMAQTIMDLSGPAAEKMRRRRYGQIINVASTSAWLYAGNYSALKRWVIVYSQSLALELESDGVSVTAICPSWVKTNFHSRGGVDRPDLPSWAWVRIDQVVAAALDGADRGKTIVVATKRWQIIVWFWRHNQWLARMVSRRLLAKRLTGTHIDKV